MNRKKTLVVIGCSIALGVVFGNFGTLRAASLVQSGTHGACASKAVPSRFDLDPVEVPGLGMGNADDRRWIAYYYRAPKPEEMPVLLGRIAEQAKTSSSEFIGSNVQFFGTILRHHPELKPKVETLEKTATTKEAGQFIQQVLDASRKPAANPAKTLDEVHALWAEYLATGDPSKLEGMLAIAQLPDMGKYKEIKQGASKFISRMTPYNAHLYKAIREAAKTSEGTALSWLNYLVRSQNGELHNFVKYSVNSATNLARQGQFDEAMANIRSAHGVFPDSVWLQRTLGWLAQQAGDFEKARQSYEKAIAVFPGDSDYWHGLATAQASLHEYEVAASSYDRALQLGAGDAAIWYGAGRAYQQKGDEQTAIGYYQKYLSLQPHGPSEAWVRGYLSKRGIHPAGETDDPTACLNRRDYENLENKLSAILLEKKQDEVGCSVIANAYDKLCNNPWGRHGFEEFRRRFETWAAQRPESHFARACYGSVLVQQACNDRGFGWANTITEQGWTKFREQLLKASEELERAHSLDPSDPIPPAKLITVAMGLNLPEEDMEKQFQRGIAASPYEYELFEAKRRYLSPKWHGSADSMLRFARETARNAPKGSITPMILADAHWELFKAARTDPRYFQQPGVWPELKEAYQKVCSAYPKGVWRLSQFGLLAFYADDYETTARQIELLGSQWESLHPDEVEFRKKVRLLVQQRLAQKAGPAVSK